MTYPARRLPADFYLQMLAELEAQPAVALPELECNWAGTYFIYPGNESFPLYQLMHSSQPLYIGKTGGKARTLSARVKEHRRSIEAAYNLDASAMQVKVLACHPEEQDQAPAIEDFFQRHFLPLWNYGPLTGLGNHGVGATRMGQAATNWDTLHPGRPGRSAEQQHKQEELLLACLEYLKARPEKLNRPVSGIDDVDLIAACLPHRTGPVAVSHQMSLGFD